MYIVIPPSEIMCTVGPLCGPKTTTQTMTGWFGKEETKLRRDAQARNRVEKEEARDAERKMRTERNLASLVLLLKRKSRRGKARAMESW